MHEFGLALQILEMAEEHARPLAPCKVTQIEIELGDLANVMYESLLFSLQAVTEHSVCAGAEILIHRVPGRGQCVQCGAEFPMEAIFGECPQCGDPTPLLIKGKEFRLLSIQID